MRLNIWSIPKLYSKNQVEFKKEYKRNGSAYQVYETPEDGQAVREKPILTNNVKETNRILLWPLVDDSKLE